MVYYLECKDRIYETCLKFGSLEHISLGKQGGGMGCQGQVYIRNTACTTELIIIEGAIAKILFIALQNDETECYFVVCVDRHH